MQIIHSGVGYTESYEIMCDEYFNSFLLANIFALQEYPKMLRVVVLKNNAGIFTTIAILFWFDFSRKYTSRKIKELDMENLNMRYKNIMGSY